jgi:hypothetical protein
MTRLVVAHPPSHAAERRYACQVVLGEFLGLDFCPLIEERADTELRLPGSEGSLRVADAFFKVSEQDWLSPASLAIAQPASGTLPAPFRSTEPPSGEGEWLDLDVFGNSFFFLSRYEEAVGSARDGHDRFPPEASWAGRNNLLTRPLVNEYVKALREAVQRIWPDLPRPERPYSLVLSHDVDWPHVTRGRTLPQVARAAAGDAVKLHDPGLGARRLIAWARGRHGNLGGDPGDTFDFLLDESERRGLKSAYYFIAGHTAGEIDGAYSLDDPEIRALLRKVHGRGHEVGLHTSYHTYLDGRQIAREFESLRRACAAEGIEQESWGSRQHYLRWRTPDTARHLDAAGLTYDTSLSFATRAGFRAGTCYEYPLFDLQRRGALRLRERPLLVMEMALFADTSRQYMALPRLQALDYLRVLRDAVRAHGGQFTLLWHNSTLLSRRQKGLYRETLDLLSERGA